jgi:PAS domain S-box-containing protein
VTTDTDAQHTRELTSLLEASRAASSTLELEPLLDVLLDQLKMVVDYRAVTVYAGVEDDGPDPIRRALAYRGPLPCERVLQQGPELFSRYQRQALEEQRPIISDDSALLDVPLIARGRPIGVLELVCDTPAFYASRHAELTLAFAQHAAAAIDNASLQRQAERLAASGSQERRAAEARYRGLFLGAADAILVTALGGRVLEVNPAAVDLLGWQQEELVGRPGPDMLAANPNAPADYSSLHRTGRWEGEVNLRRKDGTVVPTEVRSTRVELPDGAIVVSAMRDISDRRRAADILEQRVVERTQELSALLDVARDMSSTLELRALLNSMLDQLKSIVEYDQMTVQLRLENGQWQFFEYRGPLPRELLIGEIMPAQCHANHRELELRGEPILHSYSGESLPLVRRL